MDNDPKKLGRPPKGLGKNGVPERIRDYPRQLFSMKPATKDRLKAISDQENRPAWEIVNDGIDLYFERMKPKDRRAVNQRLKQSPHPPPSDESDR
jgi:hypothetical protein